MIRRSRRKRLGRPPIAPDLKKQKVFTLRLTTDEYRAIEEVAEVNMNLSCWAREVLIETARITLTEG